MVQLAWPAILLLLSGCESSALEQRTPAVHDAGPIDQDELAWQDLPGGLAEVHCSALERCCSAAKFEFTSDTCMIEMTGAYRSAFEDRRALRTRYDAKAGADCVASVKRQFANCQIDPHPEAEAACAKVFSGTLGISETCVDDAECADVDTRQTFCRTGFGSSENTCQLRFAEAEMCWLEGCQSGLFCNIDTLTCAPLVTEGDCFLITDCADVAFCSSNLRCEPKLGTGARCLNDLECRSGVCSAESTCRSDLATPSSCAG